MCLSCEDIARQSCAIVPRWRFLAIFLRPVFSVSDFVSLQNVTNRQVAAGASPRTPLGTSQRFPEPLAGEEVWGGTSFPPSRFLPGPAGSQVVILGDGKRRRQKAVQDVGGCGGFH